MQREAGVGADAQRLALAIEFLREAVFRSRGAQAAGVSLMQSSAPGAGNCGLGQSASVVLELSPRGAELLAQLHVGAPNARATEQLHAAMTEWIERQDALDRKRNHFLKDFRQRHGFERARYTTEQSQAFDGGLERINADEDRERAEAAMRVLTALATS